MDSIFKWLLGGFSILISAVVGGIGLALTVLIGLMIIDTVTGVIASVYNKEKIRSDVGIRGLLKKTYILLLIGAIYMVQNLAGIEIAGYTGDGLAIMFAIFELVSIFENGIAMGIRFPKPLVDYFNSKKKGDSQ